MDLKYDIYSIQNAEGSGKTRQYVRLVQNDAMTADELKATIQERCSLTKADVAAVLSELRDIAVQELSMGRRFYVPELGYFSLSLGLEMPENNPDKKITGKEVRLRGINFRPEASMQKQIERKIHFYRSEYSNRSTNYPEEKLWKKLLEYFESNRYITVKWMRSEFGLTRYMAQKWLSHFVEKGLLLKDGTPRSPTYFLNK